MAIEVVGFSRPLDPEALTPGDLFITTRFAQTALFMRLGPAGGSFALSIYDLEKNKADTYVTHMHHLEGRVIGLPGKLVIRPSHPRGHAWPTDYVEQGALIILGTGEACLVAAVESRLLAFSLTDAAAVDFEAEPSGYLAYDHWTVAFLRDPRLGPAN